MATGGSGSFWRSSTPAPASGSAPCSAPITSPRITTISISTWAAAAAFAAERQQILWGILPLDALALSRGRPTFPEMTRKEIEERKFRPASQEAADARLRTETPQTRSEENTSELQSLMRNSYAVFCLKKKTKI